MNIKEVVAIVTGGASGLGESVVRAIALNGGKAVILDLDENKGNSLERELGEAALFCKTDIINEDDVSAAIAAGNKKFGRINVAVNGAGISSPGKTIGKKGPMKLEFFEKILKINTTGTFNIIRLAAMEMSSNTPNSNGERGIIINTASIAAFDGQIGQAAYAASKGAIVAMTLPLARELASYGIRNVTIAPGIFDTPMLAALPDEVRQSLEVSVPFPSRYGRPDEFAALVLHVIENSMINGETIRLDGALRMAPK
jgi:NAD(P)-dependent dehydrogenase (short-subunit alcohol dehydrogenase family)